MTRSLYSLGFHKRILAVDLVVFVAISYAVTSWIYAIPLNTFVAQLPPVLVVVAISLYLLSVFEISLEVSLSSLISRSLISVALALSILLVIIYLLGPGAGRNFYGRGVMAFAIGGFSLYLVATRYFLYRYLRNLTPFHSWIYVGSAENFDTLVQEVAPLKRHQLTMQSVEWLKKNLGETKGQGVILDDAGEAAEQVVSKLLNAKFHGINVMSLSQFYESFLERLPVSHLRDDWFLSAAGFSYINDSIRQRVKKTIDLLVVFVTLPITISLFVLTALLVILFDRQNPVFTQQRTGLHGRAFTVYKLRTMRNGNAEARGSWTTQSDARVTALGGLLRRYRLDEVPQLYNVLNGTMSIIGPRPEQPEYTRLLSEQISYYDIRHSIKPGITGWAQVRFPYGASVEDARSKLEYDLYYIKNYSLMLDLSIVIKTFHTIFSGSGR